MGHHNVLLFKFRCSNFIGVRIIKEMPGSVAGGTSCRIKVRKRNRHEKQRWVWSTKCTEMKVGVGARFVSGKYIDTRRF